MTLPLGASMVLAPLVCPAGAGALQRRPERAASAFHGAASDLDAPFAKSSPLPADGVGHRSLKRRGPDVARVAVQAVYPRCVAPERSGRQSDQDTEEREARARRGDGQHDLGYAETDRPALVVFRVFRHVGPQPVKRAFVSGLHRLHALPGTARRSERAWMSGASPIPRT